MLHNAKSFESALPEFEIKSADNSASTKAPRRSRKRYRPRRTLSDRVREAVLLLAEGRADLLKHEETEWHSITFSGTRHELTLDFNGREEVLAGEEFIASLPEHEFTIPGQLVADATIAEVDHHFGADERMVVKALLLLLEES